MSQAIRPRTARKRRLPAHPHYPRIHRRRVNASTNPNKACVPSARSSAFRYRAPVRSPHARPPRRRFLALEYAADLARSARNPLRQGRYLELHERILRQEPLLPDQSGRATAFRADQTARGTQIMRVPG